MTAPMVSPNPAVTQAGGSVADKAIKYAVAQTGKPYIWGGTGPKGYDCSGLLYMAYLSAGLDISRTTHTQITHGTPLPNDMPVSQRPAGALIFPDSGHVYMALGGGQIVEAATFGVPIHVRNDYTSHAYAIRQVTGAGGAQGAGVQATAGLVSDTGAAVLGISTDGVTHILDVMLNWLVYMGLITLGGLLVVGGLVLLAEKPLSMVGRLAHF